jgi:DNA topoisomerase-3
MENVNDDGWMDAAAYDDELPFGNFNDNEKIEAPVNDDVVGVCPCCGTNVVERDMAYFCDNMDCSFVIWKDNKFFQAIGKEMTREIAEDLLTGGTVKLMGCKSRKTGKTFNCYVDITYDDEGRVQYEIRFPERKHRGE